MSIQIGVTLPTFDREWPEILDLARFAEDAGADALWVGDHLDLRGVGMQREGMFESWTILSELAQATSRVELGAQVLCQSFRNPALLAKMVSTLDRISDGRLRVVVGAGWWQPEYEMFGYDFPSPGMLVDQTRETVRILRGMLNSDGPFTYEGKHYRVREAINSPPPVRRPMPVEVGAIEDRMLRMIAREADGWSIAGLVLPRLQERAEFLSEACAEAGRSYEELRKSCWIFCAVGDDEAANDPRFAIFNNEHHLIGSVDRVVQRAGEMTELGIQDFALVLPPGDRGKAVLERMLTDVRLQVGVEGGNG